MRPLIASSGTLTVLHPAPEQAHQPAQAGYLFIQLFSAVPVVAVVVRHVPGSEVQMRRSADAQLGTFSVFHPETKFPHDERVIALEGALLDLESGRIYLLVHMLEDGDDRIMPAHFVERVLEVRVGTV